MAWMISRDESSYLTHHGIKGQKWGVRRFQNPDGSYTAAGKERYGKTTNKFEWKKSKILGVTYTNFKDSTGKEYHARLEDEDRSYKKEDAKKIQKVIENMVGDGDRFIENLKTDLSDYIAGSYESEHFGLEKMSKDEFKTFIKNNIDIEGVAFSPWIDRYGGKDMDSYDACGFGVDYAFNGVPFMNDMDGILDLSNKKIRDVGYAYPD